MHKQNMSSLYFDILAQELAAIRVCAPVYQYYGSCQPNDEENQIHPSGVAF